MYKIGVNCGITGAIALLQDDNFVTVEDMPLFRMGKHRQINAAELAELLETWQSAIHGDNADNNYMVYVEEVSAMPGQDVTGVFNFGTSYGIILGCLGALKMPFTMVRPQGWKKRAGLINYENVRVRTLAEQFYPGAPLSRKKDMGRAVAILIAKFAGELD